MEKTVKDPVIGGNVSHLRKGKKDLEQKKALFEKRLWKEKIQTMQSFAGQIKDFSFSPKLLKIIKSNRVRFALGKGHCRCYD